MKLEPHEVDAWVQFAAATIRGSKGFGGYPAQITYVGRVADLMVIELRERLQQVEEKGDA